MTAKRPARNRLRIDHVHVCGDCGAPAKVHMVIGTDRDNWLFADCDRCGEYVCEAHFEEGADGQVLCDTCYQGAAMEAGR